MDKYISGTFPLQILQIAVNAISDTITLGLTPIPVLARYGLPYSIFDLAGALRLAFVLRQLRDAERSKAEKLQAKLVADYADSNSINNSKESRGLKSLSQLRELEEPYFVKDIATVLTVIYGGEAVCAPWLQFTPSFLTMPHYPLLFIAGQALINALPSVPPMSIHTELPLSFFDALTRAFMLTSGNPGFIIKHASPTVASSPWALCIASLILANAGFFLVNVFQMLSPYGWHIKTPPELSKGGWRTMDLWVAPLMTGIYALLTQSQPAWVPYHTYLIRRVGKPTMFGSFDILTETEMVQLDDRAWKSMNIDISNAAVKPMDAAEARSICALVLCVLFAWRSIVNFGSGFNWNGVTRSKSKRVPRSRLATLISIPEVDGRRLSKVQNKTPRNSIIRE